MSVVLRDFGAGVPHRYVTHCRDDENGGYFWGHYFDNRQKAMDDYQERCKRYRN